jgi:hypothetical protein
MAEAVGLAAVLAVPFLPFGELFFEALAALPEVGEDFFGSRFESLGSVKPCLGVAVIVTSGEAPVPADAFERLLGCLSLLPGLGEVGGGPLLVAFEGAEFVEGRVGGAVDDGSEAEAFGPQLVDAQGRGGIAA